MLTRVTLLLLFAPAALVAAGPIAVTVQRLFDKPRHYENRLVSLDGYFDASEALLSASQDDGSAVVLDFTAVQWARLKRQRQAYSGPVHVVGIFEYIDTKPRFIRQAGDPDGRDIYEGRVGFRGAFSHQITRIEAFTHVP